MESVISLSILGYESDLGGCIENIRKILSGGVKWLHIDVMRPSFIPGESRFPAESVSLLYDKFASEANFDFHLMTSNPDLEIEMIDKVIPGTDKGNTIITIHREAYRKGLGKYGSKEYDLLKINTGDSSLDKCLRDENVKSGERVCETLRAIKERGYKAGLALEPGTSLGNVSEEMAAVMDMILLMGVSSGVGGHAFKPEVVEKIKEAHRRYGGHGKMIQVDGGINDEVLSGIVKAGTNNIVIGSYITKAVNPVEQVIRIKELLSSY